ncbi:MAG: FtsW/RodA/SpoVE family cell cycle protein, partial [Thermaerobacterales bacterium]
MNRRNMDLMILAVVALLLVIGVLMVFSASFVKAEQERLDRYYFLKRQAAFAMIGVAAMFAVAQVQYWHWRRLAVPALYITLALLVLVTIPSIGTLVSGARRWLGYGAFSFQPSELAKVTLLIFWAAYFAVRQEQVRKFWPILPVFGGVLGLVFALVMRQPDLGTAVAIAGTSLTMLFVAGARLGPMIMLGMASLPALAYLIFSEEYRARRIFAFLWPERDPLGAG